MSKIYDAIVTKAAEELVTAMRKPACASSGIMPRVLVIPTTEEADGKVEIWPPYCGTPDNSILIMPNANHASTHTSWYTVPYDHVRSILWQALHNQPILPRER